MRVWVFVEGESDRIALNTLWDKWRQALQKVGWGIQIIPLQSKPDYFKKVGHRAAEKLVHDDCDLAVGLPDLYPNKQYAATAYQHQDLAELKTVQSKLVGQALDNVFRLSKERRKPALDRFFPTAFRHDAEMLLLAAREALKIVLGTPDKLGGWRHPVEDQDQEKPPKHVVEELFLSKRKLRYRDTVHAKAVLEKVSDIRTILFSNDGHSQCPVFKEMLDWIGEKTGVRAY